MQIPVPTVRVIVTNQDGRVLLLRRARSRYGLNRWCLPGGKVDYGDTIESTAARELREETGLTCEHARFLFVQDSLPIEPGGMHCINLYFDGEVTGDLRLNEESSEAAWIAEAEIERYDMVFRHDEGLKRYWWGQRR